MLTTNSTAKLETVPPLNGPDSTTWRAVNLELWIPYAFITHSTKADALWISQTTILWIEDDIIGFCSAFRGSRTRKIVDISLLLPNNDKKNSIERRWVQIRELWSRRDSASTDEYPFYISMEKEGIGRTEHVTDVTTVQNVELIYRAKARARRSSRQDGI